jgi:hypothetical protein
VLSKIRGTHLDHGNYLDELKRLSPREQRRKVALDLAVTPAAKVAATGEETIERRFRRMAEAWDAGRTFRDDRGRESSSDHNDRFWLPIVVQADGD